MVKEESRQIPAGEQGDHMECESCDEAYEADKIMSGAYTYEYLQTVRIWSHE